MDNGAESYRRYLSGSDEGLVELIRDHKDGLILYLCGFTGNVQAAEEICEDTFVKIAVSKPNFSGRSSFKTFLYSIARNTAVDYMRTNKQHEDLRNITEISDDEISLEEAYIKEEQRIAVHKALRKLKPQYRQVLWLTYFEELSNEETGVIMRKNAHNVAVLASRARRALKKQLEKEGFIYENV